MKLAWSELAKAELAEIQRFSLQRWGRDVTRAYLGRVRDAAKDPAAAPDRLRPLRGSFRIRRAGSHYLILHLDPDANRLTVARVLHVRMDLERHLPGDDPG